MTRMAMVVLLLCCGCTDRQVFPSEFTCQIDADCDDGDDCTDDACVNGACENVPIYSSRVCTGWVMPPRDDRSEDSADADVADHNRPPPASIDHPPSGGFRFKVDANDRMLAPARPH